MIIMLLYENKYFVEKIKIRKNMLKDLTSDGNNDRSSVMTDRFCSWSGQKIFEDIKMTGTFVKNYIVCFIFSSVARMYYQRYLIAINKQSFIKYHLDLFIHF